MAGGEGSTTCGQLLTLLGELAHGATDPLPTALASRWPRWQTADLWTCKYQLRIKIQVASNRNGKQHISFSDNNEDLARYLQLADNTVQRFMGSLQHTPAVVVGLGFLHAQNPFAAALLTDGHCGMEDSEPQCCGVLSIQKK